MATTISPVQAQKVWVFAQNPDGTLSPATIGGGGGSGTVTSIATTAPITGGPITTTGTIGCATCTTNAAPLVSGNLVSGDGGAQSVMDSGIASSTLVTSAAALTSNAVVLGAGSQGTKVSTGITTNGASELDLGLNGTAGGVLGLNGATTGKATITAPAVAGTITNPIAFSNALLTPSTISSGAVGGVAGQIILLGSTSGSATITTNAGANQITINQSLNLSSGNITTSGINSTSYSTNNILLFSQTAPTISSGFFGTTPSIVSAHGQASFRVNVGTGVAASSGVVGLAAATNGWNCQTYNLTAHAGARTDDTVVFASSTNSVTLQNRTIATSVAANWTASDIVVCNCIAY